MKSIKTRADVGCLLRKQFRDLLETERMKDNGIRIHYRESKGFCESTFFLEIEGPEPDVDHWYRAFRNTTTTE